MRETEEAKSELTRRVQALNETLWRNVLERKNEAIAQTSAFVELMEQGWETHEKTKLISLVGRLMEQEFFRLKLTSEVASGQVDFL